MVMMIGERVVSEPIKVLIVEDNPIDAELALLELRRSSVPVDHRVADDEARLKQVLGEFRPDVILCDLALRDMSGVKAIRIAREIDPNVPAIIVTGSVTEQQAVVAMHSGAVDYVLKSNLQRLGVAVLRAVDEALQKKRHALVQWRLDQAREQLANIADTVDSVLSSYSVPDRQFTYVSTIAERVYGYTAQAFLAKADLWKVAIAAADRDSVLRATQRIFVEDHYDLDYRIEHPGGEIRWINHRARLARGDDGTPIRVDSVVVDITRRMEAQRRLRRLSRIRDVLSSVNAAVIRIRDRAELFRETCRIAFEAGGFVNVFLFTVTEDMMRIDLQAAAGSFAFEELKTRLQDIVKRVEDGSSAIQTALRTGAPSVINNIEAQPDLINARQLSELGVRAVGCFPIVVGGHVVAAMAFNNGEAGYFDDEEIALLTSLTGDLAFALDHLNEQNRVTRLSRIRNILSSVNEAILRTRSPEELFKAACEIAYKAGGFVNVFVLKAGKNSRDLKVLAVAGTLGSRHSEIESSVRESIDGRRGGSAVAEVFETLLPSVVNDVRIDKTVPVYERLAKQGVVAVGAFPLVVDGDLAGAMVFDTSEAGCFDDEEIELLTSLTNNISFALKHLAREERVARLSRIRDVLSAVNGAIVRLRDRDELFQEVCRIAVEAGGFMNVFIVEIDFENGKFAVPAFLGQSDRVRTERAILVRLADTERPPGIMESPVRSLRPSVKNDLPPKGRRGHEGVRSTAGFPLVVDGRGIGTMIFETSEPEYFDDEEIQLLTGLANNLSFALDLLDKQRRVDYLSYYDALTQLPNRTLFYNRLDQDLAAARKAGKMLALVLLDVSRFSVLNNTLGEHVGDEVLRCIADRLRESAAESRIARVAGDRFALCFPMLDDLRPVAEVVTEDGIQFFDAPVTLPDRELHVMMRAGCAVFPNDGQDAEALFQNAEAALLSAKSSGTTYRFYAPELNARLAKQLDLEARLQRAIESKQFVLYYQPKIELRSRRVIGFEALIRWDDPERGLVSPGDFIPLLERTGMIITVGRWALGEAARQFEDWRKAGLNPPRIAVNLSALQLLQERLVDDVRGAVESFSAGCGLDLEVTESMLMENFDASIAKLNAIRELGVDLSLDDFGTGYSSLAYLHQLPLNALKIDRSFIVGMTEDAGKTSIVSTIISLAQALKLKVIAEGVESEEQLRLLQLLRCDQIQGYLISKPVPPDVAAGFLGTNADLRATGSG